MMGSPLRFKGFVEEEKAGEVALNLRVAQDALGWRWERKRREEQVYRAKTGASRLLQICAGPGVRRRDQQPRPALHDVLQRADAAREPHVLEHVPRVHQPVILSVARTVTGKGRVRIATTNRHNKNRHVFFCSKGCCSDWSFRMSMGSGQSAKSHVLKSLLEWCAKRFWFSAATRGTMSRPQYASRRSVSGASKIQFASPDGMSITEVTLCCLMTPVRNASDVKVAAPMFEPYPDAETRNGGTSLQRVVCAKGKMKEQAPCTDLLLLPFRIRARVEHVEVGEALGAPGSLLLDGMEVLSREAVGGVAVGDGAIRGDEFECFRRRLPAHTA